MGNDKDMLLALEEGKYDLKDLLFPGKRMKELMMSYIGFKHP
jgi:hypothetical protein